MLGTLLKAAIPITPDIGDSIKMEELYPKKNDVSYIQKIVKEPVKSIDIEAPISPMSIEFLNTNQKVIKEWPKKKEAVQEPIRKIVKEPVKSIDIEAPISPISMEFLNTNKNVKKEWQNTKKIVQKPIENMGLNSNFEHSTINDVEVVQIKPEKFVPLEQLIQGNNRVGRWKNNIEMAQELPNNVELNSNFKLNREFMQLVPYESVTPSIEPVQEFPNNIGLNPNLKLNRELMKFVPYEDITPSTEYSITINTQTSENYYSREEKAVVVTEEKVYSMESNTTITRNSDGTFSTCIRGKVTINAKYIGHSSTTIPAEEEIKFVIESSTSEVNQLYVEENEEKSDWDNILDIYKISLAEGQSNFNNNLALLNGTIRSLKYLLDKYFPSLGETTEKWKKQKDEFFESSLEEMKQFYTEHPEAGDDFQKMLVGMEIDETQLNPLEKAMLAKDAIKAGVVKDVALGLNGIVDIVLSPLETLDALTSPNAPEILWKGLTEDIVNDWEKGTIQGRSQASGRVISMLLPIKGKGIKARTIPRNTGGTLKNLSRRVSGRSGTGVEISKPINEVNIRKVEFPKTSVKYGDHYRKVDGKNSLKPDIEYVDGNNYKYTTDSQGRISRVEGELKLQKGKRNPNAQKEIGQKKDDGGHLIANRFGGSGEIDNLVPQNKHLNRSGGEWYKMEQEWANALKEGKKVEVDIQPIYNGTSTRPDSFSVHYKIDGKETIRRMANPKET